MRLLNDFKFYLLEQDYKTDRDFFNFELKNLFGTFFNLIRHIVLLIIVIA